MKRSILQPQAIVAPGRGILAADEPTETMADRLSKAGVENSEENRRTYRQILFTSPPEACKAISGVILFHDTFYQKDDTGKPFLDLLKERNIIPGLLVLSLSRIFDRSLNNVEAWNVKKCEKNVKII